MRLAFTKMHGAGNDFVMFDNRDGQLRLTTEQIAALCGLHVLEVKGIADGDVAHAETYYLFVGRNRDETNWVAGGRYVDRLERRDGAWRIALRCNAVEWSGMIPTLPIPFADVPDVRRNGAASRSRDDLSYRRPLTNRREMCLPGKADHRR